MAVNITEEERKRRMLQHIQVAQKVIRTSDYRDLSTLLVCAGSGLRCMLEAMCGLGDYADEAFEDEQDYGDLPPLYPSVFDSEVTEAIRSLLSTIDEKKEALIASHEVGLAHCSPQSLDLQGSILLPNKEK